MLANNNYSGKKNYEKKILIISIFNKTKNIQIKKIQQKSNKHLM